MPLIKPWAGNMLSAYYSKGCDSRELFSPFKISRVEGFEEKLNRYNVNNIVPHSLARVRMLFGHSDSGVSRK